MEELVKAGDYAALMAHCEDAELKVPSIVFCTQILRYKLVFDNGQCEHMKIFYRRLMEYLIHKYTVVY